MGLVYEVQGVWFVGYSHPAVSGLPYIPGAIMSEQMAIRTMLAEYRWFCRTCASYIDRSGYCGREFCDHEYRGMCAYTQQDVMDAERKRRMAGRL